MQKLFIPSKSLRISKVKYAPQTDFASFRTMQPAISSNPQIPIYIKNTFQEHSPGTRIYVTSTTTTSPDNAVAAFSSIDSIALLNLEVRKKGVEAFTQTCF